MISNQSGHPTYPLYDDGMWMKTKAFHKNLHGQACLPRKTRDLLCCHDRDVVDDTNTKLAKVSNIDTQEARGAKLSFRRSDKEGPQNLHDRCWGHRVRENKKAVQKSCKQGLESPLRPVRRHRQIKKHSFSTLITIYCFVFCCAPAARYAYRVKRQVSSYRRKSFVLERREEKILDTCC
jgi:hypothetical protein